MNDILTLEGVYKKHPKSSFAIKDISFSLPEGSILGFIGENGAGKSTTINCILNVIKKDSGVIKLWGREMEDTDTAMREEVGVVYDSHNFPEYLTVNQLMKIFENIYSNWDKSLYKELMQRLELPEHQKIKTYSRGMSMKLAIVMALAHRPKLLLLDEATSGLDPVMREEILSILLDFVSVENHAVLLSSHITGDLEKIADYIVLIHQGEMLLNAPKDELIYDYGMIRCSETAFLQMSKEDILSYRKKEHQIDVLVSDKKRMSKKYKELIIDSPSLDEIMLLLVKGEKYARIDKDALL